MFFVFFFKYLQTKQRSVGRVEDRIEIDHHVVNHIFFTIPMLVQAGRARRRGIGITCAASSRKWKSTGGNRVRAFSNAGARLRRAYCHIHQKPRIMRSTQSQPIRKPPTDR